MLITNSSIAAQAQLFQKPPSSSPVTLFFQKEKVYQKKQNVGNKDASFSSLSQGFKKAFLVRKALSKEHIKMKIPLEAPLPT